MIHYTMSRHSTIGLHLTPPIGSAHLMHDQSESHWVFISNVNISNTNISINKMEWCGREQASFCQAGLRRIGSPPTGRMKLSCVMPAQVIHI